MAPDVDDPQYRRLSSAQQAALRHVNAVASRQQADAESRLQVVLQRAGLAIDRYEQARACIQSHARVVVHFHPDRHTSHGKPIAAALLEEGTYRNQFETGLSAGSLSAFHGGERDAWERTLFGEMYHQRSGTDGERPKYGALELVRFVDGPIPRFGSCYFVLKPSVSNHTSFTFMGSEDPNAAERLGTMAQVDRVLVALLEEIEAGGTTFPSWPPFRASTLGLPNPTVGSVLEIVKELATPRPDPMTLPMGRVLDSQIEAQVHGRIDLREDVELLVADPAFAMTPTGQTLRDITSRYGFPLRWHCGFSLPCEDVPDDFRGPVMPRLAHAIADEGGMIDAAVLGAADTSLHRDEERWRDFGTPREVRQSLKQLWHVLVRYGSPARHP